MSKRPKDPMSGADDLDDDTSASADARGGRPASTLRALFDAWPPTGFRPAFSGDLEEITVPDVLSMLNHGRRSGLLVTISGGIERGFAFVDGDILWVRSDKPDEGTDATRSLSGLLRNAAGGNFTFLRAPTDFAPTGERVPTLQLLLECLRRLDEESG